MKKVRIADECGNLDLAIPDTVPCGTCYGDGMVPSYDCDCDCCPTCGGIGVVPAEPWYAHVDQAAMDAEACGQWVPDDGAPPW